jgi:phasin family protein
MFGEMDLEKMMKEFKIPGVDVDSMMSSQRRNFEAIGEANKVAMEGMQAVAQRQSEIMREAMEEMAKTTKNMAAIGSPQEASGQQADMARESFEKALANMRELAEMVAKSNSEAFEVVNRRMNESLEEFKGMMAGIKK